MSGGQAYRRMTSARLLREIPEVEKKIESGDLTVSGLAQIAASLLSLRK